MLSDPKTLLTEEEYLAFERQAEVRSEFHEGGMFAMAGASCRHNRIVTDIVAAQFTGRILHVVTLLLVTLICGGGSIMTEHGGL